MSRPLVLVPGTWAWSGFFAPAAGDWWQTGSPLRAFFERSGFGVVGGDRPFVWSTQLDFGAEHRTWSAGGVALYAYLVPPLCLDRRVPPDETRILAHSHGGQVAFYAAAAGLRIRSLVTVSTPVRRDMAPVIAAARPNIGTWLHVHSDRSDWQQLLGGLFDGRLGVFRSMPEANVNLKIPDVGHARLLHDPAIGQEYWPTLAGYLDV
jgi:pimeloyl-ACP methyl ester carboxylesterase